MEKPIKMDNLGVPLFSETSMCWMVECWYMVTIGTVQLSVPLLVRSIFLLVQGVPLLIPWSMLTD